MLKILRQKEVARKITWFIAIVIIISFGFLGTAYLITGNSATYAGKVFGQKISIEDFQKILDQARIQAIIRHGDNFNKVRPFLNLEAEAWDRLILLKEAQRRKIKITDEEVVQAIEEYPFFQRNNLFDILLYNDILRYVFKTDKRAFEESVRDNLKISKIYEEETSGFILNEDEVFDAFKKQNEKVQVSYILVGNDDFRNTITVDDTQAQSYYDQNKLDFLMPPSINVEYLSFDYPKAKEGQQVSEQKTIEEAVRIYQKLEKIPDLKRIAAENNLDVKETGFMNADEPKLGLGWSYDLLNTVFSLETGSVQGPFETTTGMVIVRVKEKRDAYVPPLEDVREKVNDALVEIKIKSVAKEKTQSYLAAILEEAAKTQVDDFAQIAKNLSLEIYQTPMFTRGQYLPKVGIAKDFQEAAFALTSENKISNVVETAKGFCILHLDNVMGADESLFEEQKDEFAQTLWDEGRNELFNQYLVRLRQQAGLINSLETAKKREYNS